jgi:GT2 family glycosyltransferase
MHGSIRGIPKMDKKVFIVLLNWDQAQLTIDCLDSLYKMKFNDFDIILVDNASKPGSLELILQKYPDLKYIKNNRNLGFTGGNNVGIIEALKNGAKHVMLLNNDTVVHEDMLSELVKAIESGKDVGMVGPKIYYYGDSVIWSAGVKYDRLFKRAKHIGYRQKDTGQFSQKKQVDELTFCAVLIKKSVIEQIGLLDESFFRTAEDTEYSLRMKRAGYNILFVPTSVIWHKVSSSTGGEDSPQNVYYGARNSLFLIRRYFKLSLPFMLLKYIIKSVVYSFGPHRPIAKATWDAVIDFIKGRAGQVENY